MRSLFITLLLFAGAVVLYDGVFAPLHQRVLFEREPAPVTRSGKVEASPMTTAEPTPSMEIKSGSGAPEPARTAGAAGFVPPVFETLETLTKNWAAVPASAFPRRVSLRRDTEFRMAAGSARVAAGASVVALGCEGGRLTLAPSEESTMRGDAGIDDTDLKQQIMESYRTWTNWRTELLRKQWELRNRSVVAQESAAPTIENGVDEHGRPLQDEHGSYPLLVASMHAGQVSEITPGKVKRWFMARQESIDSRPTWTVDLLYDAIVFCGVVEARAQAHVRDGRVIRWIYPGSGEPVP